MAAAEITLTITHIETNEVLFETVCDLSTACDAAKHFWKKFPGKAHAVFA